MLPEDVAEPTGRCPNPRPRALDPRSNLSGSPAANGPWQEGVTSVPSGCSESGRGDLMGHSLTPTAPNVVTSRMRQSMAPNSAWALLRREWSAPIYGLRRGRWGQSGVPDQRTAVGHKQLFVVAAIVDALDCSRSFDPRGRVSVAAASCHTRVEASDGCRLIVTSQSRDVGARHPRRTAAALSGGQNSALSAVGIRHERSR